ncbi:hypothetical protein ACHWQZ_G001379 [Mnemiopsis leidyi]
MNRAKGQEAGAIEIYTDQNNFFLRGCHETFEDKTLFYGGIGKNGVWIIERKSGENPELIAHFQETIVFHVKFSASYCRLSSWQDFWRKDANTVRFPFIDTASVQFRKGHPGWKNIIGGEGIHYIFNLQKQLLKIETNSRNREDVMFYDANGDYVGGLELHIGSNQFFLKLCKPPTHEHRGSYQGANGKNGVWSIKRKSGESPELVAQFNGIEKFTIQLSSYCTTASWRDYWEKDAFFLKFNPGPQRFGIGNTGEVCTGLSAGWQGVQTSVTFPVYSETVLAVGCKNDDTLTLNRGSSRVTCKSGTEFTYVTTPACISLGE